VTLRPAQPDDDAPIVAIDNRLAADFPPTTVEEMRFSAANRPTGSLHERRVAERDGQIVGHSLLREMWWVEEPGSFSGQVTVDPDHRRRGVGARLYDALEERVRELGGRKIYGRIRDDRPEAERFATRRGFRRTGRVGRLSRLTVREADLEGYEGLEERLADEGIRIATLAELGAGRDETLHALHELCDRTAQDIPSSVRFTATPCEQWHREVRSAPGMAPERIWVALAGARMVGTAILKLEGPGAAHNDYTGVDRAYRGRGVARALKRRAVEWSLQNGVDWIYTGNDAENTRMLAINIRLGYRPLVARSEMVKEL
jgi:GNAT superfamily N-acetyltransferase